jgi:hypothetical protein
MRRQLGQTPTTAELSPRVGTRRGLLLFWLNERRVNSRYRSTQVRRLGATGREPALTLAWLGSSSASSCRRTGGAAGASGESCSLSRACSADFERSGAHPVGMLIPTRAALMLVCAATLVAVAAVAPARALAAFSWSRPAPISRQRDLLASSISCTSRWFCVRFDEPS